MSYLSGWEHNALSKANPSMNTNDLLNSRYATPTTNATNWSSMIGNGTKILSGVGQGLSGLASLYNAFQSQKSAKEQFAFEKAAYNTNLANSAKMINNSYDAAASIGAQLASSGSRGSTTTADEVATAKENAKSKHVASTLAG